MDITLGVIRFVNTVNTIAIVTNTSNGENSKPSKVSIGIFGSLVLINNYLVIITINFLIIIIIHDTLYRKMIQ